MSPKTAKADVTPVRQRTQYTCMSTAMMMALNALGHELPEDEVNRVMGARAMKGASWEQALACAQHYGCRATLTMPSTVKQLKGWTDAGTPVMIAWNPEGRDWSHASLVYDVTESLPAQVPAFAQIIGDKADGGRWIWVADPNLPNPEKTVRIVSENDFYSKWYEKWPDYLVRRPACAIEREISLEGTQLAPKTPKLASTVNSSAALVARMYLARAKRKKRPSSMKTKLRAPPTEQPKARNEVARARAERGNSGGGSHRNRTRDVARGHSRKPKHKQDHTATYSKEIDYTLLSLVARIGPFSARNPRERKGLDTLVDAGLVVRYLSPAGGGTVYEVSDDGRNALGRRARSITAQKLSRSAEAPT